MLTSDWLVSAKSSPFWNNKDPSKWSPDEIQQLTNDSPWARPVDAQLAGNSAAPGTGRRGRMGRSGGTTPNVTMFRGVARWLSAKPMLLALKLQLPKDFADHYVIGVSGIPLISGHTEGADNTDSFDTLKEQTTLRTHGQEQVQPGMVAEQPDDTSTILFGFLPQFIDLEKAKTATFSTKTGPFEIEAKFDLTKMTYKGDRSL